MSWAKTGNNPDPVRRTLSPPAAGKSNGLCQRERKPAGGREKQYFINRRKKNIRHPLKQDIFSLSGESLKQDF
jgi:hypothetical protein